MSCNTGLGHSPVTPVFPSALGLQEVARDLLPCFVTTLCLVEVDRCVIAQVCVIQSDAQAMACDRNWINVEI